MTYRDARHINRLFIIREIAGSRISGTTAERMLIRSQSILMTGQLEVNGTSIVDVTDPAHPVYYAIFQDKKAITNRWCAITRVCDGKDLPKGDPSAVYLLRTFGGAGA